tara:strand:+ start:1054 stop:1308 length:255 start_codon:yes stop_codon:yes gene_type:complete
MAIDPKTTARSASRKSLFKNPQQKETVKKEIKKLADISQIYDFVVNYGAPAVALGELGLLGYVGKRFFESDEKKMKRYFGDKKK